MNHKFLLLMLAFMSVSLVGMESDEDAVESTAAPRRGLRARTANLTTTAKNFGRSATALARQAEPDWVDHGAAAVGGFFSGIGRRAKGLFGRKNRTSSAASEASPVTASRNDDLSDELSSDEDLTGPSPEALKAHERLAHGGGSATYTAVGGEELADFNKNSGGTNTTSRPLPMPANNQGPRTGERLFAADGENGAVGERSSATDDALDTLETATKAFRKRGRRPSILSRNKALIGATVVVAALTITAIVGGVIYAKRQKNKKATA